MLRTSLFATAALGLAVASSSLGPSFIANAQSNGATTFKVRIENVSTAQTLKLSNGSTAPAPNAPGLYVVTDRTGPLFAVGQPDRGEGLERLAEDGNPALLATRLRGAAGVQASGVFDTPVGDAKPGAATPGKAFEFAFTAPPGSRLFFASMFGQSNDLFFAPDGAGIALFGADGKAIDGDLTGQVFLWDAGTEVNEEPGLGPNQAPRQAAPNTGRDEHGVVQLLQKVKDGFTYPAVGTVLRVTIRPVATSSMSGGPGR